MVLKAFLFTLVRHFIDGIGSETHPGPNPGLFGLQTTSDIKSVNTKKKGFKVI